MPPMRALVAEAPGRLALHRLPRPEPGPGEVRVRVGACGICGSDLHLHAAGLFPTGITPGHEMAGFVDALGEGVEGLTGGDSVCVEPFRTCGVCPACRTGRDPICREARLLGFQAPGGLAEYVLAPARRLFRAPADLPMPLAALAEPLAVVVHGLRRGGFAGGQRVLVLGAGSIGLLSVLAARALGAAEVLVTARHPHQAERARALGADRVLEEARADPAALDALGRETPVDLVLETVGGSADTLRAAVAAVRPGGCVSVLGLFLGSVALDPMPLLLKETTLAWSYCYARDGHRPDFEDAIALLSSERDAIDSLLTHRVSLDEADRAFALAADRSAGVVKVSVTP
jgi:threonine dehydrogenase-like Zn-dependent dehydrogenase